MRRAILFIILLLALAGCTGNNNTRATTPVNTTTPGGVPAAQSAAATTAPRTATVGDTVQFTNGPGTAGTVTLNGVRTMQSPEGPIGGAPTHGTYLVANITMAISSGTMSANPLWFQASSSDGTTYPAELGVLNNQMPSQDVVAGRQVRGEVAFDVPRGQELLLDFVFAGGPPLATFSIPAQ